MYEAFYGLSNKPFQLNPEQQLRQGVTATCHIGPLDLGETQAYIEHRLKCAGSSGRPAFDSVAFEAIFKASGGIPHRVNLICDRLLLLGFLSNKDAFGPEDVNQVVSEIHDESTIPANRPQGDGSDWDDSGIQALTTTGSVDIDLAKLQVTPGLAEVISSPALENILADNPNIGGAYETSRCHPVFENEISVLELADRRIGNRLFKIRAANSNGHRSSANILIKRRYEWRGYEGASLPVDHNANRITLMATEHDEIIGTITVGLDGHDGLLAEDVFPDEVATLRAQGRKVCEFTKLAMDPTESAKRVLASLFHVAFIVAHHIKRCDTLVLEVNPRHVNYYKRMLGCRVLGAERPNLRVNAPAVLLCVEFSYIDAQIAKFVGNAGAAVNERTLYPYSFSQAEETGIISRLHGCPWL